MAYLLTSDGSLDTLILCNDCGQVERYDSYALIDGVQIPIMQIEEYRINAALERMEEDHECEGSE